MNEWTSQTPTRTWASEPVSAEVMKALLRLASTEGVLRIAVMPDVHLAQNVCIGTVFASDDRIFPEAVGTDIGCGMTAMRFETEASLLDDKALARQLLRGLSRVVPSNRHPLGGESDWLPAELRGARLSTPKLTKEIERDGRVQFGTLGRGNHFLEFQSDEEGRLWIMVHSGSRGLGQTIAQHHLGRAEHSNMGLLCFSAGTDEGLDYLRDAQWAVDWARQSRARILESSAMLLQEICGVKAESGSLFDSVHNFVRIEEHDGRKVWVHRKGANSAADSEYSIIPGSMGTASYHVMGRGNREALCSCSHGAGRAMSRSDARATISEKQLRNDMRGVHFDDSRTRFLRDEAPGAYKEIDTVMRAQADLVRQVRRLRPVLNHRG